MQTLHRFPKDYSVPVTSPINAFCSFIPDTGCVEVMQATQVSEKPDPCPISHLNEPNLPADEYSTLPTGAAYQHTQGEIHSLIQLNQEQS